MPNFNNTQYQPNYAALPGDTLQETLRSLGMSQAELAKRIARPEKTISEIINGLTAITPETAIQLERALGISAAFWINLEKNYQLYKANIEAHKQLEYEIEIAKRFDYANMASNGFVPKTTKILEKVEFLLKFFGVSSLKNIEEVECIQYKQSLKREPNKENLLAWLRQGILIGQRMQVKDYDKRNLEKCLMELRNLTVHKPEYFSSKMSQIASECGVAVVFVPDLPKTYAYGATRWLGPSKALVQLSLRGSTNDMFWFTFFHELGHILLHSKKDKFIELNTGTPQDERELEADGFAREILIPENIYQKFITQGKFSEAAIVKFAASLNIHPGIVVGRLQHDNKINFSFANNLKLHYQLGPLQQAQA